MKRLAALLLAALVIPLSACDETKDASDETPPPVEGLTAQVAFVESSGAARIEVREPGSGAFATFAGGKEIPSGSTIRTGSNTRARLAVDGALLVVDHGTSVTLVADAERTIDVETGRVVLSSDAESKGQTTVILPTGRVVLHGTKVSAVAGESFSTVSVATGRVEVLSDRASLDARAGDEIVIPRDGQPVLRTTPELGAEFGWSELVDPDEEAVQVPRGLGKLVGKAPGGERERSLELVEHNVETNIQGNIAYTEVEERFRNPTSEVLEGVYRFPLPADAKISRLALEVDGKLMEGEFLETERAEWIWRDIINQSRDPAMLKWKHGNQFELRIFPIQPRSIRRVIIGYTQRMEPTAGGYRYVYPMPVDHAGTIPAESFSFAANVEGHDPTGVFQVSGYDAKVSHRGKPDDSARTEVRWSKDDFVASGDLSIRFAAPFDSNGFEAFRFDSKREDRGFFSIAIRPDLPRAEEIAARDLLVVVDRSYHRKGQALELQKRVAEKMLGELDPLDNVSVIACNTSCEPVGPAEFGRATPDRVAATKEALEKLQPVGASNPVEVARVASEIFGARGETERDARLVWFADGVASAGELRPGKLRDALARVAASEPMRVTLVGVGGDTDEANVAAMTEGLAALRVELDPAMTTTGHALSVLSTLYGDLLTHVSVELPEGAQAVYPRAHEPIAPGDELVVTGRVDGDLRGDLVVRGKLRGDDWSQTYPVELVAGSSANGFLPKIWASARIRDLELSESDEKGTIVGLSKRYGVLSRYTTLLALENEEMMKEYGVKKRRYDSWDGTEAVAKDESRGAEMPEMPQMAREEESEAPASAPAPRPAKKKSAPRPRPTRSSSDMALDEAFGGIGGVGAVQPRSRRMGRRGRARQRIDLRLEPATLEATAWEKSNVERWKKRLASEPGNRTRTMRLIRAMHRAGQFTEARERIDAWIATNDRDPEALVQLAQWHSLQGDFDAALTQLANGVDVAPRGSWIQERAHRAYDSVGSEALACAHGVALRALQKRPEFDEDDILACPLATELAPWTEPTPTSTDAAARKAEIEAEMRRLGVANGDAKGEVSMRGNLQVEAKWEGSSDVDIIVIEPDGRALSWLSQRRRVDVGNVRGGNVERLALPVTRSRGTYEVMVVRASGNAPVKGSLEVTFKGKKKVFPFRLDAAQKTLRVAEAEWSWSW